MLPSFTFLQKGTKMNDLVSVPLHVNPLMALCINTSHVNPLMALRINTSHVNPPMALRINTSHDLVSMAWF